jgi:hypothetical protein
MMRLIEETHTYINDLKPSIKYTSVTTILGKYKHKFDEDFHAQRVADRKGVTKEQVIAEWREINRQANEYGTNLHGILERFLLSSNGLYVPRDEFEKTVISAFKESCMAAQVDIAGEPGVRPEYIMSYDFNDELGIAGTSDIIQDIDKNRFNVWDFKTNKSFEYDSKYSEYLLFPVEHLTHCQYNDYALQISIYGLMYERETGKKFNRGGLFYWDKQLKYFKLIPVPYMKKEAELIVQHYRMQLGV